MVVPANVREGIRRNGGDDERQDRSSVVRPQRSRLCVVNLRNKDHIYASKPSRTSVSYTPADTLIRFIVYCEKLSAFYYCIVIIVSLPLYRCHCIVVILSLLLYRCYFIIGSFRPVPSPAAISLAFLREYLRCGDVQQSPSTLVFASMWFA